MFNILNTYLSNKNFTYINYTIEVILELSKPNIGLLILLAENSYLIYLIIIKYY